MKKTNHIIVMLISISLFGCGGGGGGGGSEDNPTPVSVSETLDKLGVDQDTSPRTYPDGSPIPEEENPRGSKTSTWGVLMEELAIVGFGNYFRVLEDDMVGPNPANELFRGKTTGGIPALRTRVGVAANTDGDAQKEVLFVGVSGTTASPYLTMIEVRNHNGTTTEERYDNITEVAIGSTEYISEAMDIAAGDIDNDGKDEIVVVYRATDRALLAVLDDRDTGYKLLDEVDYGWNSTATPGMVLRVSMGNVDKDGKAEIAVLYSRTHTSLSANAGTSTYYIYDYEGSSLVEKTSGLAEADIGGGVIKEIMYGDISLGDIDGDGLDEVVMGGVEWHLTFTNSANATFLQIALDDAENNFEEIAALENTQRVNDPVLEPYVETWDPDGNGIKSIQVHGVLYQDFVSSGNSWVKDPEAADLTTMLGLQASQGISYEKSTAAMGVGDLDQDGREELILSASNGTCINIIDYDPGNSSYKQRTIGQLVGGCRSGNNPYYGDARIDPLYPPVLLPVDFDGDALVLSYDERHEVVYSEPVIVAALAAPPCYSDPAIGQDTSACYTSFGLGASANTGSSSYASVTVGFGFGFEAKAYGVGFEADFDIDHTLTRSFGWELEISRTVTYTAGAMTDAVIFTSIPYDNYYYTVINDPKKPERNGETFIIAVPRAPLTTLVSKDFYNAHTPADKPKLGSETFSHTVGNPKSYAPVATADSWLGDALNGLLSTYTEVLSQTGSVDMELALSNGVSYGLGYDFAFNASLETTGGASVKARFGVGLGHEVSWGVSTTTAVSGSVGAIDDPDSFAANGYSWGIGLYPVRNTSGANGDVFYPVVNYWVE